MIADDWAGLQRAARFPPHGQARRKRDELRRFTHSLLASELGATQPVMWFPIGLPVPEGWRVVRGQDARHHHAYSQLIARGKL